ncbi:MAG TPA: TlpA disulfide reductase family protein [Pyrinomonadaceae bacterium]|nr:TlpA disulfide reductase family protein [Pyrinomonadaceae bacterium]
MLTRALLVVSVGLSILLSSLAAPAQKRTRRPAKSKVAAVRSPVVTEIKTDALVALLNRQSEKPLLVNFWATWCDPCRDEFPDLVKIDADYRKLGLDFVTVSLDDVPDIKTTVPEFLQKMKATMPAYLLNVPDPDPLIKAVDPTWQGDLPATILYTTNGQVAYKHFGRVNPGELRSAIDKVIGARN